jgi:hypothetical protein
MTTLVDVLDSFVKIGLGAAISGITTYMVTSVKSKKDLDFSCIQRKRELLEIAAEGVEIFTNSVLRYWTFKVQELSSLKASGGSSEEENKKLSQKINDCIEEVISTTKELSNAESKLMLLGYGESQKLLRKYGEFCNDLLMTKWLPNQDSINELRAKKKEVLGIRKNLFDALRADYESLYLLKKKDKAR